MKRKKSIIQGLLLDEHADLTCITKTWLDEVGGLDLSQLYLPGFTILQQVRLVVIPFSSLGTPS